MKHAVMTTALAAMVAVLATIADGECAQGTAGPPDALRQQLEQRFDVTSLQDAVLLGVPTQKNGTGSPDWKRCTPRAMMR